MPRRLKDVHRIIAVARVESLSQGISGLRIDQTRYSVFTLLHVANIRVEHTVQKVNDNESLSGQSKTPPSPASPSNYLLDYMMPHFQVHPMAKNSQVYSDSPTFGVARLSRLNDTIAMYVCELIHLCCSRRTES